MSQESYARIDLNGYWGPKSAHVVGDLKFLQKKIREAIQPYCNIDTSRPPHIEVTDQFRPFDSAAYSSINGRQINISNYDNWIMTNNAIMIKTGYNIYGKETHFTVVFCQNISSVPQKVIAQAILNAIKELQYF